MTVTAIRELERKTIAGFLTDNRDKFKGQVLDIGCGKQPYRNLIESFGGTYHGYDRAHHAGSVVTEDVGEYWDIADEVDTVMMTQVWQYIPPHVLLDMLCKLSSGDWSLKRGGWFVATGPTNWPVVEAEDLWRQTTTGVLSILEVAHFVEITVEPRFTIDYGGESWSCGWAATAKARG